MDWFLYDKDLRLEKSKKGFFHEHMVKANLSTDVYKLF